MKAEPQRMISSSSPFRRPHEIKGCKSLLLIVAVLSLVASSLVLSVHGLGFALVTGATGQTGRIVTQLLLDQGYDIRVFVRDIDRARNTLKELTNDDSTCTIEYCQGELNDMSSIAQAFECTSSKPLTHVVYCAGGDGVDYYHVSYKAVAECAKLACQENSQVENFVFISTAWATRPYSIASLLFNTMYDSIPMALHYMGEQEIRKAAAAASVAAKNGKRKKGMNYVILRPGGLNTDENYIKKFGMEKYNMGLTYQQGDDFTFLGDAGRPGMYRTQLANAVVTAATANAGKYTVEITGSGTTGLQDSSIYETLIQDGDEPSALTVASNDEIMNVHAQAISEMKNTAIGATVSSLVLLVTLGWIKGIISIIALDALIIFIWSKFYATRQI